MKTFKRIQALFLAVIMTVMTFGTTTAFAAESDSTITTTSIAMLDSSKVVQESIGNDISPQALTYKFTDNVNITTTKSAAGTAFGTPVYQIQFNATFKSGVIVAIRLHDITLNGDRIVQEWQSSNGSISATVNVSPGGTYIFEYLLASGSGTVNVRNSIYFVTSNSL